MSSSTTAAEVQDPAASAPQQLVCQLPPHSRIKVIGLGGVGSIVLEFGAMFLRSLQRPLRIVLIDGDQYEFSNSARMRFGALGNKAEVKAAETAELLQGSQMAVIPISEYVGPDNLSRLIRDGDYIFLCVDNHATRRLVSDHCETLANVALFSGGNDGVEPPERLGVYGNAQAHIRRDGEDLTPPITRYHPEIRDATGQLPGGPNCGQLALSSPQILMANLAAASHLLNLFFACTCGRLTCGEVQFDILEQRAVPYFPVPADLIATMSNARR